MLLFSVKIRTDGNHRFLRQPGSDHPRHPRHGQQDLQGHGRCGRPQEEGQVQVGCVDIL